MWLDAGTYICLILGVDDREVSLRKLEQNARDTRCYWVFDVLLAVAVVGRVCLTRTA